MYDIENMNETYLDDETVQECQDQIWVDLSMSHAPPPAPLQLQCDCSLDTSGLYEKMCQEPDVNTSGLYEKMHQELDIMKKDILKNYFMKAVFKNDICLMKFIISEIQIDESIIVDAIKQTAYFGLVESLKLLLSVSVLFRYFPETVHANIHEWLHKNIDKSTRGESLGWRCGPDSGLWPSTKVEDYIDCLHMLEERM